MTTLILPNELTLKQATEYMGRLQVKGYDCWFKTVVNKNLGTREIHIIVEDNKFTLN